VPERERTGKRTHVDWLDRCPPHWDDYACRAIPLHIQLQAVTLIASRAEVPRARWDVVKLGDSISAGARGLGTIIKAGQVQYKAFDRTVVAGHFHLKV
jgi:hypothetical protein